MQHRTAWGTGNWDQTIASDCLASVKKAATTCLKGALESATPECRQFFERALSESLSEHAELQQIMQRKGWYKPYDDPWQIVQQDLQKAQQAISPRQMR